MKRILAFAFLLIALSACTRSWTGDVSVYTTATPDAAALAAVEQSIEQVIFDERENVLAFVAAKTNIENIRISRDGQYAIGWLIPIDPETNIPAAIEPGLVLLQKDETDWRVWLPTTPGWREMLATIPNEILSERHKEIWDKRVGARIEAAQPAAALTGYKLPWEAGISRYLTQSTCHDQYTPSGNAHYAFDFSTYGELWNIYAAKGGIVWLWKDDIPTCYEYTCSDTQPLGNYMVIKDTSTNPVSYQLYLHLKQNSIPAELKAQGTPIAQGQFIGNVDNTGQSWGHHLHFQVQVPLYGENYYWGRSIDIVLDDVDINGGRPRLKSSWCNDEAYCTFPGDVCNDFRATYTSQNTIVEAGPMLIYFPFITR